MACHSIGTISKLFHLCKQTNHPNLTVCFILLCTSQSIGQAQKKNTVSCNNYCMISMLIEETDRAGKQAKKEKNRKKKKLKMGKWEKVSYLSLPKFVDGIIVSFLFAKFLLIY